METIKKKQMQALRVEKHSNKREKPTRWNKCRYETNRYKVAKEGISEPEDKSIENRQINKNKPIKKIKENNWRKIKSISETFGTTWSVTAYV